MAKTRRRVVVGRATAPGRRTPLAGPAGDPPPLGDAMMSEYARSEPTTASQDARRMDDRDRPVRPRHRLPVDEFHLDPEVISALAGRDKARLRRLTPIRGVADEPLDPIVVTALRELRARFQEDLDHVRKRLAERYLNVAEAVTARLNRQALPRTTRLLLSTDGVYEQLLLKHLQEGVGRPPAAGHGEYPHDGVHDDASAAADFEVGEGPMQARASVGAEESGDGQ